MAEIRHASTVPPGTEIDGFVIVEVAGRGGMGVVYRARQSRPNRIVALKVIAADLADDPEFRARFTRESSIAAGIEHPNVIPVHAVGEAEGLLYIAMRFVEGTDMRKLLAQETRLPPRRATMIVDQVGQALDAAHAHGLVHRDVKPANVLIATAGDRDHVYLSDFGVSRHIDGGESLTGAGTFVGSVDYVSPEQARGEPVDATTDVYSLGCVLFEALSGSVPFPVGSELAKLYARDSRPPPSILDRAPDLPPAFESVLMRALARSPEERYLSAGDLGRAALAAAGGESLPRAERSAAVGEAAPRRSSPPTLSFPAATTPIVSGRGPSTRPTPVVRPELPRDGRGPAKKESPSFTHRRRVLVAALALAAAVGVVLALASAGELTTAGATLKVPGQYRSIQAAVNAARPGQTIAIGAGTFREQVTINKRLTLTGAGVGRTTIKAPATLTPGPLAGLGSIVTLVGGGRVDISRLTVAGPGTHSCTSSSSLDYGILVGQGATLDLHSAAVSDIRDTPAECARPADRAIGVGLSTAGGQASPGHAQIAHDVISGYGNMGIYVTGSSSTASITGNKVSGRGSEPAQFVAGILVTDGATATIAGNAVTDNHCASPLAAALRHGRPCGPDPLNQSHDDGIIVIRTGPGTIIRGNTLSGNDVGISLWSAPLCCTVTDNKLTHNAFFGALLRDNPTGNLKGGTISGGQVGVGAVSIKANTSATLGGVKITGTSVAPTKTYSCCGHHASIISGPSS